MMAKRQKQGSAINDTEVITVLGKRGYGKSSWVKNALPNIPRFIVWDTLGEYGGFEDFDTLDGLYKYVHKNQSHVFQASYVSLKNFQEEFDAVCKIVAAVGNCTFIIEEVDTYATPQICPDDLMFLLKKGRHFNVDMIFVSRRPAEINRMITAQSNRFICFKITEPIDLRYLSSSIGDEVADKLPTLKKFEYVEWNDDEISEGKIAWKKNA